MTLFGAAYYPEYMPSEYDTEDRIKTDLSMMKKAGMNVIRIAESTWSVLEPEKDKFNFFYIDKTLEIAESMDYGLMDDLLNSLKKYDLSENDAKAVSEMEKALTELDFDKIKVIAKNGGDNGSETNENNS